MHREISPDGLAPPAANYAHAVLSIGATRWLHTSGVVATLSDGTVPDDIGEQADIIWRNLGAMLADVGMGPTDVVSVATYVVPEQDLGAVMAARDRFLGDHRAASTLVVVHRLVRPEWLLEISLVASAGEG